MNLITKYTQKWIVALLCIGSSLFADWSMPQELIYPTAGPATATNPSIASDPQGNAVAVWIDVSDTGSFQAARLTAGDVNSLGQPNWILTNPISTSNVQATPDFYSQMVGMDRDGNALAVWTDGIHIYVSRLAPLQNTWSEPTTINTQIGIERVSSPFIAVAKNGNVIVSWNSSPHIYEYSVFCNVFDASSNSWLGQTAILAEGAYEGYSGINQICIDPKGNGVIVLSITSNQMQLASYNVTSNTWTPIFYEGSSFIFTTYSSIDSEGNALIVWVDETLQLQAATLLLNATSLTNQHTLSNEITNQFPFAFVTSDSKGNGVAAWSNPSGNFSSARYSPILKTWEELPILDLGGITPIEIMLSSDSLGNTLACWTVLSDPLGQVQTTSLNAGDSLWKPVTTLSAPGTQNINPLIELTSTGDGLALWQTISEEEFSGSINASISLNMFLPLPPSYFKGSIISNKFLTQTDRIHDLTWGKSSDPSVVKYNLYRNNKLITSLPSEGNVYFYKDHNRNKKKKDIYKITSVNQEGAESLGLYVTLQ